MKIKMDHKRFLTLSMPIVLLGRLLFVTPAISTPVWEDSNLLSLDESLVPFAMYDYYQYDTVSGNHSFSGDLGDNKIIKVGVLPPQHLYGLEPDFTWDSDPSSSDYGVWLNDDGSADFVWSRGGMYAVRVERQSGEVLTEFMMADCYFADAGRRAMSTPEYYDQFPTDVDLVIVGLQSDSANSRLANAARDTVGADKVVEATTVAAATEAIEKRQAELGRKIKVIIVGHGGPGFVTLCDRKTYDPKCQLSGSGPGMSDETKAFTEAISGKVSELLFVACSVGQGETGQNFLNDLYRRSGADTYGYDQDIATYWLLTEATNRFWIMDKGQLVKGVPEPATVLLLGMCSLFLLRRRQGS